MSDWGALMYIKTPINLAGMIIIKFFVSAGVSLFTYLVMLFANHEVGVKRV